MGEEEEYAIFAVGAGEAGFVASIAWAWNGFDPPDECGCAACTRGARIGRIARTLHGHTGAFISDYIEVHMQLYPQPPSNLPRLDSHSGKAWSAFKRGSDIARHSLTKAYLRVLRHIAEIAETVPQARFFVSDFLQCAPHLTLHPSDHGGVDEWFKACFASVVDCGSDLEEEEEVTESSTTHTAAHRLGRPSA